MSKQLFLNRYRIPSARAQWHDYNGGMYFVTICTKDKKHYFGKISNVKCNHFVNNGDLHDDMENDCCDNTGDGKYKCRERNVKFGEHMECGEHGVHGKRGEHGERCRDWARPVSTKPRPIPPKPRPTQPMRPPTTPRKSPAVHPLPSPQKSEPKMVFTTIGQYAHEQLQNITNHYPYAEIPLWVVMPNHIHAIVIIDECKIPYERRAMTTGGITSSKNIDSLKGWLSVVIGGVKSSITKFANQHDIPFAWQMRFHDHIIRNPNALNRIANYIENNVQKWAYKYK